jgi:hypothetical protein
MIIAVFIPKGDGEDPLPQHGRLLMGDQCLIARIGNDRVQTIDQPQPPIDLTKQNRPRIGGDASTGKIRQHGPSANAGKWNHLRVTLCHVTAFVVCGFGTVVSLEATTRKAVAP